MKIEQLTQVIEIARTGSITLAARNLYMSQSNLSTSVRDLEKEINQRIFIRSNSGTTLTAFGEAFLEQAKIIVRQFRYIQGMSSFRGEWGETFSVASYYFLFVSYIYLEVFRENNSSCMTFKLKECSRSDVIDAVARKEAEIGIVSIPAAKRDEFIKILVKFDLEYHRMTTEDACILVGKNSPFYTQDTAFVRLSDLTGHPIISYEERDNQISDLEKFYTDSLKPSQVVYVSDRASLLQFLQNSDVYHIATKNRKAYRQDSFHNSIKAITLADPSVTQEIGWLKVNGRPLSKTGKEFLIKMQEKLVLDKYKDETEELLP